MRSAEYFIEPSYRFSNKVIDHIREVEKQRHTRLSTWFVIVAFVPFVFRILWSLMRGDFVSVSSLPLASYITYLYSIFMSGITNYALLGAGILLAVYIVGLPSWKKIHVGILKRG